MIFFLLGRVRPRIPRRRSSTCSSREWRTRRAGIHALVDRAHAQACVAGARICWLVPPQLGQALVRKALPLQAAQGRLLQSARFCSVRPASDSVDLHELSSICARNQGSTGGFVKQLVLRSCRCGRHRPGTGCARGRASPDLLARSSSRSASARSGRRCRSPGHARPSGMDSWKVRPMAITSPTDFICVVRRDRPCGNFSKREARDLGDHVVDRRAQTTRALRRR